MAINQVTFSGNSRFASDFGQLLDRAIGIASLPLTQLESQRAELGEQQTALKNLDARFEGLQSALSALTAAAEQPEFNTSISNGSVVKAKAAAGAFEGVYQIEVVDLGSNAAALSSASLPSVSDPRAASISGSTQFTLTVDGQTFSIQSGGVGLSDLAEAINASGASVQATVVNVGPSSAPDYRLSIQAQDLAAISIQLNDGSADLLETTVSGSPALYRVNGQPPDAIASRSRSITLGPGLTADLLGVGTSEIRLSRGSSNLAAAVSGFVNAFNSAVAGVDQHRGADAGVLSGQSLLGSLSSSLRSLGGFSTGSGAIASLTQIGVTFAKDGTLSFDQNVFNDADIQQVREFLGSTSGVFGDFAASLLDGIERSGSGILESALETLSEQIKRQDERIADDEERLTELAENLQAQMAAADALIASLEQQVIQVSAIFESIREAKNQQQ